jgi:two pore calcium channel protein
MLYAYNTSTWYTLYFVIFILFGVFFLMNVLLGVIFDNYKRHQELSSKNRSKRRLKIIARYYQQIDKEDKGYLTVV